MRLQVSLDDNSRRHVVGVNKRKSHGCSSSDDECCDEWHDVFDLVRKSHAENTTTNNEEKKKKILN